MSEDALNGLNKTPVCCQNNTVVVYSQLRAYFDNLSSKKGYSREEESEEQDSNSDESDEHYLYLKNIGRVSDEPKHFCVDCGEFSPSPRNYDSNCIFCLKERLQA